MSRNPDRIDIDKAKDNQREDKAAAEAEQGERQMGEGERVLEYDLEPTSEEMTCLMKGTRIDMEVRFRKENLHLKYAEQGYKIMRLIDVALDPALIYLIHIGEASRERWEGALMDFISRGGDCIALSEVNIAETTHIELVKMMAQHQYATYETTSTRGRTMFVLARMLRMPRYHMPLSNRAAEEKMEDTEEANDLSTAEFISQMNAKGEESTAVSPTLRSQGGCPAKHAEQRCTDAATGIEASRKSAEK